MKKYLTFLLTALIALLSFSVISCGDGKRYEYEETNDAASYVIEESPLVEEAAETIEPVEVKFEDLDDDKPNDVSSIAGIYEVTDIYKFTWIIELNPDKTAIVYRKDLKESNYHGFGIDSNHYGSWSKSKYSDFASLSFSGGSPNISFAYRHGGAGSSVFNDEWIYWDSSAAQAKNPELRLSIRKIKD